jgi:X-Pro dipeptidyl-peptidase
MNGTLSTGCPLHGGPGDVASMKAVIDWLNGRAPANGLGVDGLTTIWCGGRLGRIRRELMTLAR